MPPSNAHPRRQFLHHTLRMAALTAALPAAARASVAEPGARTLSFVHTHTQERIEIAYADAEARYLPQALATLNRFLRDHYTGEVGVMDPRLFDRLHRLRLELGSDRPFEVISAYRCPATNARLRESRGGGVARQSLHLQGCAIDVRLQGAALADLRDAALAQRAGGVGYYADSRFVHIDTGRVRSW